MAEDVLVIGGGPAGIASASYLQRAGISYRVVERSQTLASTWASLYPSLRLNTTRFFSHLPGRRFPLHYGLFPTAKQYHAYLFAYARDYALNIELGVEVLRVTPEADGWRVDLRKDHTTTSTWYPCIISATGRFGKPYIPHIEGMETFSGQLIHAHDYLGPAPFAGQRVMVVGNGPSGVDIATELARHVNPPVLLAQRTGVVLRPRYPWGLPKHLWKIISEKLPPAVGEPLYRRISDVRFSERELQGIKTPLGENESMAAGGTRGRELIREVQAGHVISVDGPVRFLSDAVEVQNGDVHPVDAVIMGTGYLPVLDEYLDIPITERDSQQWPARLDDLDEGGKRQVKGWPGLYLVGVFYKGKGAMYNFNTEAAQAVREIEARLAELTDDRVLVRQG